jgi:hypothetical protein
MGGMKPNHMAPTTPSAESSTVDWVTKAGAIAFLLVGAMTLPAVFGVLEIRQSRARARPASAGFTVLHPSGCPKIRGAARSLGVDSMPLGGATVGRRDEAFDFLST